MLYGIHPIALLQRMPKLVLCIISLIILKVKLNLILDKNTTLPQGVCNFSYYFIALLSYQIYAYAISCFIMLFWLIRPFHDAKSISNENIHRRFPWCRPYILIYFLEWKWFYVDSNFPAIYLVTNKSSYELVNICQNQCWRTFLTLYVISRSIQHKDWEKQNC